MRNTFVEIHTQSDRETTPIPFSKKPKSLDQ